MNRAVPAGSPQHSGRAPHQSGRRMRSVALLGALALVASTWTGVALAEPQSGGDGVSSDQSSAQTTPAPQATEESAQTPLESEADVATGDGEGAGQTAAPMDGTDDPTAPTTGPQGRTAPDAVTNAPPTGLRVAGPDGGNAPYLYWTVKDANGAAVGGASYTIEGPRTTVLFSEKWDNDSSTVDDNIGQSGYNGSDLDPDPGEFLVKNIGSHTVTARKRYRIQASAAPEGYRVTSSTDWVAIDGESFPNQNVGTGWTGSTYTFPQTVVAKATNTVIVKKGSLRTGTGNGPTGVSTNFTAGVRFGLFDSVKASSPTYTCEVTDAAGTCTFSNVAVAKKTMWVGELEPTSGSDAAQKFTGPLTSLNGSPYRYQTPILTGTGDTYNISPSGTSGYFANRLKNPQVAQTCSAGVKVAVVMDTSGSVASNSSDLAKATTALVDGLTGTPSSVALFTFADSSPGTGFTNHPIPESVQTTNGATTVKSWYSTDNGQKLLNTPQGGTNWDMGLWTAAQGASANKYDVVFVLTDGNPTYSQKSDGTREGSGSETTLRELERAVFSANAIKNAGARVITVGIGSDLKADNLASVSGPTAFSSDKTLNQFDYVESNWDSLKSVLANFAQGLKCETTVSVLKQAQPYGQTSATPAQGWAFTMSQTGAATVVPSPVAGSNQTTGADGKATWKLTFKNPSDTATITLTEAGQRAGWSLEGLTCSPGSASIDVSKGIATLTGVGIGQNITCTFKNVEHQVGALSIMKAFDNTVPEDNGKETAFTGSYTCAQSNVTVAAGTWSRTGTGDATLTPSAGYPASNAIPVGATCSVTEDDPSSLPGLPNTSWKWSSNPTIGSAVTITKDQTRTITVTNKAERVFGNFSVTKVIPAGSTADSDNKYSGGWACTLGNETVSGEWGPIAANGIWTSSDASSIPLGSTCSVTSESRPQWPVASDHSHQWDGGAGFSGSVEAVKGSSTLNTVTVTNKTTRVLGSVTWTKVAEGSQEKLSGSTWTLTGPGIDAGGVEITDCVAATCPSGAYKDQDPAPGVLRLQELAWGEYTLVEKSAPAGYVLDTLGHSFTIGSETPGTLPMKDLGNIKNTQVTPPDLPLTGGMSTDAFLLGGGGLLGLAGIGGFLLRRRSLRLAKA